MRYLPGVFVALAAGCVGCWGFDRVPSFGRTQPPIVRPPDAEPEQYVAIDVACIECTYADRFLDQELWQRGDEHIDLDVQPLLEENGLRVCRIGGLLPARLQTLLSSKKSCSQPRRLRAEMDKPTTVLVGARQPHLTIQYRDGDKPREFQLDQAQCLFEVTPIQGDDEGVKLRFRARIRHGQSLRETKVANDPGGSLRWTMEQGEPTEDLPALTWDLPIRSDEFIVVGTRLDRPGTFGHACFVPSEKATGMQTVLVLRARSVYGKRAIEDGTESSRQGPPLAAQASVTERGYRR